MIMRDLTRADTNLWDQMYYIKLKSSTQKTIMNVEFVLKKIQDITTIKQCMKKIESIWQDKKDNKMTSQQSDS